MTKTHEEQADELYRFKFVSKDVECKYITTLIDVKIKNTDLAIDKFESENPSLVWRSVEYLTSVKAVLEQRINQQTK